MDLGLKDRVALVAASSTGLGKAVALGLAREGAKLALCSRSHSTLEEAAAEIRLQTGVEVLARSVDVTVYEQVRAFEHAEDESTVLSTVPDDAVGDAEAVHGTQFQRAQNQQVERALEDFG